MTKEQKSQAGWLARRREKKREKQLRTGDTPERAAERKRYGISPEEKAADKAARGRLWGPSY
jgi:hypothetical protein